MGLADLFPDGDYRFQLGLRRGEPRDFFAARDASGALLAERARWLAREPDRYAALQPEGEPVMKEFLELANGWGLATDGVKSIHELGARFEPDILLLARDPDGEFRLRGGVLCFPTGWALTEKLGHALDVIHGVVPGLNSGLAGPIHQFLAKLKPGVAFFRDNWGITATNELNLHPARAIPRPALPVTLDRLWLRVEHQALLALPKSGGICFGIRVALHCLDFVARDGAGARLRHALETMPTEVAVYKRIENIRSEVIRLL